MQPVDLKSHTLVSDLEAPKNETELEVRKPVDDHKRARMLLVHHVPAYLKASSAHPIG